MCEGTNQLSKTYIVQPVSFVFPYYIDPLLHFVSFPKSIHLFAPLITGSALLQRALHSLGEQPCPLIKTALVGAYEAICELSHQMKYDLPTL
jgi:hypothetical protein